MRPTLALTFEKVFMSEHFLNINALVSGYGKAEVLHGLDLHADKGQVITVIGPNGAGKSTLLNTLIGFIHHQGEIHFDGQNITQSTLEERVMMGMALVPESRELFTTMTVQDNLELGGYRQMLLGNGSWRDELEHIFSLFPRLKERRAQWAGTLSGGERQMLAIGRALMSKPKLLMLDEPSLGLAPLIVKEILGIVQKLRDSGVTIILVEQNARAALQLADYAYVLEMGNISLHGPAKELAQDHRIIETYLGASQKRA